MVTVLSINGSQSIATVAGETTKEGATFHTLTADAIIRRIGVGVTFYVHGTDAASGADCRISLRVYRNATRIYNVAMAALGTITVAACTNYTRSIGYTEVDKFIALKSGDVLRWYLEAGVSGYTDFQATNQVVTALISGVS